MIRVLIVASIWLYREGLAHLLSREGIFDVVGTSPDRLRTASAVLDLRPDVVLLDLSTPESGAIAREVRQLAPGIPVVAIAVSEQEEDVLSSMEAGIVGHVTRDGSTADLVAVVENAARGELQCSAKVAGSLARRVASLAAARDAADTGGQAYAHLTLREREIVRLLEHNLSNKEIATQLGIEVATVKNHVHNLLEKLNLHRRVDVSTRLRASGDSALSQAGNKRSDYSHEVRRGSTV